MSVYIYAALRITSIFRKTSIAKELASPEGSFMEAFLDSDWLKYIDDNREQFWINLKDQFISKELQESFEILEQIIGTYIRCTTSITNYTDISFF